MRSRVLAKLPPALNGLQVEPQRLLIKFQPKAAINNRNKVKYPKIARGFSSMFSLRFYLFHRKS